MARSALFGNRSISKMTTEAQKRNQKKGSATPVQVTPVKEAERKRRHGGGTPAFVPTNDQRQLVMLGAAIGWTQEQIAKQINWPDGISEVTLRKHFADELDHGAARVMARVAGNLVAIAADKQHPKAVTAAIFYLKARAGWRDSAGLTIKPRGEGGEDADDDVVEFTVRIGDAKPKEG
jgi:hypothetical protein